MDALRRRHQPAAGTYVRGQIASDLPPWPAGPRASRRAATSIRAPAPATAARSVAQSPGRGRAVRWFDTPREIVIGGADDRRRSRRRSSHVLDAEQKLHDGVDGLRRRRALCALADGAERRSAGRRPVGGRPAARRALPFGLPARRPRPPAAGAARGNRRLDPALRQPGARYRTAPTRSTCRPPTACSAPRPSCRRPSCSGRSTSRRCLVRGSQPGVRRHRRPAHALHRRPELPRLVRALGPGCRRRRRACATTRAASARRDGLRRLRHDGAAGGPWAAVRGVLDDRGQSRGRDTRRTWPPPMARWSSRWAGQGAMLPPCIPG